MYRRVGGFTMLETMIFLAVSTAMFVSAIAVFSGTQESTEFSQSIRELEAAFNDSINDTATGLFPDVQDVACVYSGSAPTFTTSVGSRSGDNNGCLFVGKLIQFGNGSDNEAYVVHTLIGDNNIASAAIGAVNPETDLNIHALYSDSFDTAEEFSTKWGTEITHAFYRTSGGIVRYVWAAGILYESFGSASSATNSRSGVANVALYAVTPNNADAELISNYRVTPDDLRQRIPFEPQRDFIQNLQDTIVVCLRGGNDQRAAIEIGNASGGLNATSTFNPPAECEVTP